MKSINFHVHLPNGNTFIKISFSKTKLNTDEHAFYLNCKTKATVRDVTLLNTNITQEHQTNYLLPKIIMSRNAQFY